MKIKFDVSSQKNGRNLNSRLIKGVLAYQRIRCVIKNDAEWVFCEVIGEDGGKKSVVRLVVILSGLEGYCASTVGRQDVAFC